MQWLLLTCKLNRTSHPRSSEKSPTKCSAALLKMQHVAIWRPQFSPNSEYDSVLLVIIIGITIFYFYLPAAIMSHSVYHPLVRYVLLCFSV